MPCFTFAHDHVIYRVVRTGWINPLDASFSRVGDKRWNPPGTFPVLYACCSESVARAITFDLYRTASIDLDDLTPAMRPELVEIQWAGDVVDMFSPAGIGAAGFDADYPLRTTRPQTQAAGTQWQAEGKEGIACRSASLARAGFDNWSGPHETKSELAILMDNAANAPTLLRRRSDMGWLLGAPP